MIWETGIPALSQASSDEATGRTLIQTLDISRPVNSGSSFAPVVIKTFPVCSDKYSFARAADSTYTAPEILLSFSRSIRIKGVPDSDAEEAILSVTASA